MLKLSFPLADLHLCENEQGFFVVSLAGKEILKTKSQRSARGRYLSLKSKFEKRFPASELTPVEKRKLLEREVKRSIMQHPPPSEGIPRISPAALIEIEMALSGYYAALEASRLAPSSQGTYHKQAENFVQWLKGEFEPGCHVAP